MNQVLGLPLPVPTIRFWSTRLLRLNQPSIVYSVKFGKPVALTSSLAPSKLRAAASVQVEGVVLPVVTPPGAIQLEVEPFNAKLVNVPVFEFPESSDNAVTVELFTVTIPWLKW